MRSTRTIRVTRGGNSTDAKHKLAESPPARLSYGVFIIVYLSKVESSAPFLLKI